MVEHRKGGRIISRQANVTNSMFHTIDHKRASTVLKDGTTQHDSELHVEDMSLPQTANPIDEKATVSGDAKSSQGVTEFSGPSSNLYGKLHKPKLPPIQDT